MFLEHIKIDMCLSIAAHFKN